MADINLLPQEKRERGIQARLSGQLQKVSVLMILLVSIAGIVYAGTFGYFYIANRISTQSRSQLEQQIQDLQPTEQRLILLRDRIKKSGDVFASTSATDESESVSELQSTLPPDVNLRKARLTSSDFDVTLAADQSSKLTEVIRQLTNSGKYIRIELVSLAFNPKERYTLEIKLVNAGPER